MERELMNPPLLIIIVGPTAVGKTDVGIEVAKIIEGEVISGDSMQIYRHMDIGTAKPSPDEMQGIPHYMLDIMEPNEEFSVALFQEMVEKYIREIGDRGKIPILVGGTGLYVRSVIDHYDFTPISVEPELREKLNEDAITKGNDYLYRRLQQIDPATAEKLHPNDTRRIVRALEVYISSGKPISSFHRIDHDLPPKYSLGYFGLNMDRQELYKRIEKRVDKMIEKGLVAEVEGLLAKGYHGDLISMQGIGYKEIIAYFRGECSLEEAIGLIKRNTRRFAKRQLTWFRRDTRIKWFDVEKYKDKSEIAHKIVRQLEGQLVVS